MCLHRSPQSTLGTNRTEEWDEIIDSDREKVDIKRKKKKRPGVLVAKNVREPERVVGCSPFFSHTTRISLPLVLYLNPVARLFRPSFYPTRIFFGLYLSLNTSFRSLDPTSPLSVPVLCPCRPFVIVPFNKKKYSPTRIATSRPLLAGFPPATLLRNEHVG